MATRKNVPPNRPSGKIRFIMLEADIGEDNLSVLAQAITTALRPAQARRLLAAPPSYDVLEPEEQDSSDNLEAETDDAQGDVAESAPKAPAKPRKYPTPKVIDVDLDTGLSFQDFAKQKGPTEITKRYLAVAAWFKEHRGVDGITADHVYTCFKKIGWSTSIKDFVQPFRDLSRQGWGTTKKSTFTINHIGLDLVQKMTPA